MGFQPTNLEETTVSQLTEVQGQTGDGRALGGHIASCNIRTSFTTIWLGLGLGLVSGRHYKTWKESHYVSVPDNLSTEHNDSTSSSSQKICTNSNNVCLAA